MSLFTAEAEQQSLIPTVEEIIVDSAQAEEKTASEEIAEVTVEEAVSDVAAEEEAGDDPVDAFLAEYENEVPVIYREENVQEQMSRHESARVRNIRRERSVPLLILYYLAAIPLCLVATLVLLIPTLISLALAFVFAVAGIAAVSCAFGSFVIFADILVVLGAGLVLLALGLLFLWLFVWFIGGAIAGMINGAIKLGNRLCTKEVAA